MVSAGRMASATGSGSQVQSSKSAAGSHFVKFVTKSARKKGCPTLWWSQGLRRAVTTSKVIQREAAGDESARFSDGKRRLCERAPRQAEQAVYRDRRSQGASDDLAGWGVEASGRRRPFREAIYLGGSTTISQLSCLGISKLIPDVFFFRYLA